MMDSIPTFSLLSLYFVLLLINTASLIGASAFLPFSPIRASSLYHWKYIDNKIVLVKNFMSTVQEQETNDEKENLSNDILSINDPLELDLAVASNELCDIDAWEISSPISTDVSSFSTGILALPYVSSIVRKMSENDLAKFLNKFRKITSNNCEHVEHTIDPLWEQVLLEAQHTIQEEPAAGPQIYTLILSQPSLVKALVTIVSHEIENELMPATTIQNLFLENLHSKDVRAIHQDIMAASTRSPSLAGSSFALSSEGDKSDTNSPISALHAVLFNGGLHALLCHRVSHNLWKNKRTGLAYYFQSTVSRKYSADIHPAATIGNGIYLNSVGAGVVIGETAVIANDVTILQGVTLGGTGKERGDRHPKVGQGAILHDSSTVLGNIQIGEMSVITAKSIVTKPVPPLARVSGVPAKVKSYRTDVSLDPPALSTATKEIKTHTKETSNDCIDFFHDDLELADFESLDNYFKYIYSRYWDSNS